MSETQGSGVGFRPVSGGGEVWAPEGRWPGVQGDGARYFPLRRSAPAGARSIRFQVERVLLLFDGMDSEPRFSSLRNVDLLMLGSLVHVARAQALRVPRPGEA